MKKFITNHPYIVIAIAAVVLSFIVFGNGIDGDFVFDDTAVVEKRGDLKQSDNLFNLFISPYHQNTPETSLYRPVTMATYSLNYLFFGHGPKSFHIINIILHAINVVLVFWFIKYLFSSKKLAGITALLFLVHPIHTEAVTSIVGRSELLMFLFSLLTIFLFIKKRYILSAFVFLLAMWSKESAIAVLPILAYVLWTKEKQKLVDVLKGLWLYVISVGIYALFRFWALGEYFLTDIITTKVENPLKFADFFTRIFTAFKVLYLYVYKLVWPFDLSADYSFNTIKLVSNIFSSLSALVGLVLLALLIYVIFSRKTRGTLIAYTALLFLVPYIIFSNIFVSIGTIMGERLIYFSSLGFILLIAFFIHKGLGKRSIVKTASIVILVFLTLGYAHLAIERNKDWDSSEVLFNSAFSVSQDGVLTRTALAAIAIRDNNPDEAKRQLEYVFSIIESNAHSWNLYGILAHQDGDYEEAEKRYLKSIKLANNAVNQYINISNLYIATNRPTEAADALLKVIEFVPLSKDVTNYLYITSSINEAQKGIDVFQRYIGDTTDPELLIALGASHMNLSNFEQALSYFKEAQRLGISDEQLEQWIAVASDLLERSSLQ